MAVTVVSTNLGALLHGLEGKDIDKDHNEAEDKGQSTGNDTGNCEALTRAGSLGLLQRDDTQNNGSDAKEQADCEEAGQNTNNTENHRGDSQSRGLLRCLVGVVALLAVVVEILAGLLVGVLLVLVVVVLTRLTLLGVTLAVLGRLVSRGVLAVLAELVLALLTVRGLIVGVLAIRVLAVGTLSGRILTVRGLIVGGLAVCVVLLGRSRLLSSIGVLRVPLGVSVVILRPLSFFLSQLQ